MQTTYTTTAGRRGYAGFDTVNAAPKQPSYSLAGLMASQTAAAGAGGEPKNQAPFTTPVPAAQPIRGVGDAKQDTPFTNPAFGSAKAPAGAGGAGAGGAGTTGSGTGAAPTVDPNSIDFSGDPVLAQVRAMQVRNDQASVAGANAQQKQALIDFGDPDVARKVAYAQALGENYFTDPNAQAPSGITGDEQTAQAAAANPNSTVAQLLAAHNARAGALDNKLNSAGGFFSSERGNEQGAEANQYLGDYNTSLNSLGQTLAGLIGNLNTQRQSEGDTYQGAMNDAYNRAIQWRLAHPGDGGSGGSGGTGGAGGGGGSGGGSGGAGGGGAASGASAPSLADVLGAAAISKGIDRANGGYEGPLGGPQQATQSGLELGTGSGSLAAPPAPAPAMTAIQHAGLDFAGAGFPTPAIAPPAAPTPNLAQVIAAANLQKKLGLIPG